VHVLLEREENVAAVDDDTPVDPVVLAQALIRRPSVTPT
jgi:hypothetical protein